MMKLCSYFFTQEQRQQEHGETPFISLFEIISIVPIDKEDIKMSLEFLSDKARQ